MEQKILKTLATELAKLLGFELNKKVEARPLPKQFDLSKYKNMNSSELAKTIEDIEKEIANANSRNLAIKGSVEQFMNTERHTDVARILFEGTSFSPSRIILRDKKTDELSALKGHLRDLLREKKEKELVNKFKEKCPQISDDVKMHVEVTPSGGALVVEIINGKNNTSKVPEDKQEQDDNSK